MAKRAYIGVPTEVPTYGYVAGTSVNIVSSNLSSYFNVTHGDYAFYAYSNSSGSFVSQNTGEDDSTARTTLTARTDMDVSFQYGYSTESGYDKFYVTFAGTTIANGLSGATTTKTYSGRLTKEHSIVFKYVKDSSDSDNNDNCWFSNIVVTPLTTAQTGTETKNVARKIKKGYIGIDGVARRIKKAYIGIGGVARPCFSGGELEYYGTITALSTAISRLAATTVGNYALFGGGHKHSLTTVTMRSAVDAYDRSLTRTSATSLSTGREGLAATTVGNYALFGGGGKNDSAGNITAVYNKVDAYDTSLTRTSPTALSTSLVDLAATTVGNYALFGGGQNANYTNYSVVAAYNASLTKTAPTGLATPTRALAATSVGNYALFGGGYNKSTVTAYDASLTRTTATALSEARQGLAATTVGNYALFGGGGGLSSVVDAYDASLTRTIPSSLSVGRWRLAATTVGDYALFGGGYKSTGDSAVDAYDRSLTKTTPTALSAARGQLAATTIGSYALFGGGTSGSNFFATVDAYTAT